MNFEEAETDKLLADFLDLSELTATAFPELLGFAERAILLQALALANTDGLAGLEAWSTHAGIRIPTLERFAKHFASFGLVSADDLTSGYVRLEKLAFARLQEAFVTGFRH